MEASKRQRGGRPKCANEQKTKGSLIWLFVQICFYVVTRIGRFRKDWMRERPAWRRLYHNKTNGILGYATIANWVETWTYGKYRRLRYAGIAKLDKMEVELWEAWERSKTGKLREKNRQNAKPRKCWRMATTRNITGMRKPQRKRPPETPGFWICFWMCSNAGQRCWDLMRQ